MTSPQKPTVSTLAKKLEECAEHLSDALDAVDGEGILDDSEEEDEREFIAGVRALATSALASPMTRPQARRAARS